MGEKEHNERCNVSRFADFIQHIPVLDEVLQKRSLTFALQVEKPWAGLSEHSQGDLAKKKQKKEDKFKAKEEHFKKIEEQKKSETGDISIQTNVKEEKKGKEEKKKDDKKPEEEKKEQPKKEPKQQQAKKKEEDDVPAISKLDIRVGKIVKIWPDEKSDKLYNEEIDIGNGEIRTIASGLKKRIPIDVLKDSLVLVLCNLKGRSIQGYFSHGMVMCASENAEDGQIEALRPPEGSQPGDLVTIGTFPRKPVAELNPKKNPFDEIKDHIKVNDSCVACFHDAEWTTPKGKIKTIALKNAKIS